MNRVNRLKRRRRKRLTIGIVLGCIVLLGIIIWYYVTIQASMWEERREMKRLILEQSELVQIDQFHQFVTEDVYHVVTGLTDQDEIMYVAVNEDGTLHSLRAEKGVSEEEIVQQHQKQHPDAEIIRIRPGIWRGYWVWEIYYRKEEEAGTRSMYDYYNLIDGELLETFRLRLSP